MTDKAKLQDDGVGIASAGFAVAGLALGMALKRPGIGAVTGAAIGLFWRARVSRDRLKS